MDFNKARDEEIMGWQQHQLDYMHIIQIDSAFHPFNVDKLSSKL